MRLQFLLLWAFVCCANDRPGGYYLKDKDCASHFRALGFHASPVRLGYGHDGKVFRVDTPDGPITLKEFTTPELAEANFDLYELLRPLAGNPKKHGLDIVEAKKTTAPAVLQLTYVDASEWTPELKTEYWKAIQKFQKALRLYYDIEVIERKDPDWGCVVYQKGYKTVLGELALHQGNVLYDKNRKVFVIIDPM